MSPFLYSGKKFRKYEFFITFLLVALYNRISSLLFQLQSLQINLLVRSCTIKNIPNSLLAKLMLITSEPIIKFNI